MKSKKNTLEYYHVKQLLLEKIKKQGGWVNCHSHIDRAFTISKDNFHLFYRPRPEKWKLNAELRRHSTTDQIYDRMAKAIEYMLHQGVHAIGSFIDVDYDIKDKGIKAATKIREKYKNDITIKYLNQSSYGILNKEAREWFEVGADFADIIGGLLKADQGKEEEHLDILLEAAYKRKKMVHIHVDEQNITEEKETAILIKKTIEHNMQNKVVGIHGISINTHPKHYRETLYSDIKKAGIMFISCPMSWLNERRSEELTPTHNPITPVDEMLPFDITVGIGTDNIADIWMPFNDAHMWNDLRVLIEAARIYDIETLVNISTVNGRKILGLS